MVNYCIAFRHKVVKYISYAFLVVSRFPFNSSTDTPTYAVSLQGFRFLIKFHNRLRFIKFSSISFCYDQLYSPGFMSSFCSNISCTISSHCHFHFVSLLFDVNLSTLSILRSLGFSRDSVSHEPFYELLEHGY